MMASDLDRCLAKAVWAGEKFVVDSASVGGSQKIAADCRAQVVRFQFNGTWPKNELGLENLSFRRE